MGTSKPSPLFSPSSFSKEIAAGVRIGQSIAEATIHARDLSNAPGSEIYPETLAEDAKRMGRKHGFSVTALDKKKILPCSVWLDGEYGITGAFAGVPVVLGEQGMEKVIEIKLNAEENDGFMRSVDAVRSGCAKFT